MVIAVLTLPACPHTGGNTLYGVGCADMEGVLK